MVDLVLLKGIGGEYRKVDGHVSAMPVWNYATVLPIKSLKSLTKTYQKLLDRPEITQVMPYPKRTDGKMRRTLDNFDLDKPISILILDIDKAKALTDDFKRMMKYQEPNTETIISEINAFIYTYLPSEFHNVSWIFRASSSFGVSTEAKLSGHLIFILKKPALIPEIINFIELLGQPFDASVYKRPQPIFTSAPKFINNPAPFSSQPFDRIVQIDKANSLLDYDFEKHLLPDMRQRKSTPSPIDPSTLPGLHGAFCRTHDVRDILTEIGYIPKKRDRFLSPDSKSKSPGVHIYHERAVCFHENDSFFSEKRAMDAYQVARHALELELISHERWQEMVENVKGLDEEFRSYISEEIEEAVGNITEFTSEKDFMSSVRDVLKQAVKNNLPQAEIELLYEKIKAQAKDLPFKHAITKAMLKKEYARLKHELDEARIPSSDLSDTENATLVLNEGIVYHHRPDYAVWTGNKWDLLPERDATKAIMRHVVNSYKGEWNINKLQNMAKMVLLKTSLFPYQISPSRYLFHDSNFFVDARTGEVGISSREDAVFLELPFTKEEFDRADPTDSRLIEAIKLSAGDDEQYDLLHRFAGMVFAGFSEARRFLWLYGPTGSGKTLFANMIKAALPEDATLVANLTSFTGRFGLQQWSEKQRLFIVEEVNRGVLDRYAPLINTLKNGTGNSDITVEVKFSEPRTFKPHSLFILIANNPPHINDFALFQRVLPVKFRTTIEGSEKAILEPEKIFEKERAVIFKWGLEGFKKFIKQGHIEAPESAHREFLDEVNRVVRFFTEHLQYERGEETLLEDIRYYARQYFQKVIKEIPSRKELMECLPGIPIRCDKPEQFPTKKHLERYFKDIIFTTRFGKSYVMNVKLVNTEALEGIEDFEDFME